MNFIPVNEPLLNGNEEKYLLECIKTGWISSEGPFVKKFEDQFASKIGTKFAIAVSNGTDALQLALDALELSSEDEVILPTFTIISCALAVIRTGAKPVLVDSDPLTWNIDVHQIEEKITSKTKAIMVVHTYGLPVDMTEILKLTKKYNLTLIEDAAEAIGQTCKTKESNDKQYCGSFGDISIFSFYPNKHITTGEGGMILTNSPHLAEKCRSLRNLCFMPEKRFYHKELGYNCRMTNMQAALGVAQLEQLDSFLDKKRLIGKYYTELLSNIENIQLPLDKTPYADNLYWVYGLVISNTININADVMMQKLKNKGVGTRPFFWCMHQQPVFNEKGMFLNEKYPVAENIARRGFYLPSGLSLTYEQIEYVAESLKEVMNEFIY